MEAYTLPIFKPEDTIDQAYYQHKEELLKMQDTVVPQKSSKQQKNCKNPGSTSILRQQHMVMNNHYHIWVK